MPYDEDPVTEVSGEERVIDCGAIGVIRWEVSQKMWDFLAQLPEADRDRLINIMADKIHEQCHGICAYVARFVDQRLASDGESDSSEIRETFPESWLHE